jgi:hypothetical protein
MKATAKKLLTVLIVSSALFGANAHATSLTLNSPGVVGIWNILSPNPADNATRLASAQYLLDLSANTGSFPINEWVTSSTEYSGTLTSEGVKHDGLTAFQSISGYDWAFAKYDGPNAGYVLFYLGGAVASSIVPQYPANLWTNNPEKYGVSGVTFYNLRTNTEVPDAGASAILLGLGLITLALFRRKSS